MSAGRWGWGGWCESLDPFKEELNTPAFEAQATLFHQVIDEALT